MQNCRLKTECPEQWDLFEETKDPKVRFCGVCRVNVYWCDTPDEFVKHSRKGRCVAFSEEGIVRVGEGSVR